MHTVLQNKHTTVNPHTLGVQLKQLFSYKQPEKSSRTKNFSKSNCQTNESCWKHGTQKSTRKSELRKNETNLEAEG